MLNEQALQASGSFVRTVSGEPGPEYLVVIQEWDGSICRFRLRNEGGASLTVKEVVLFEGELTYATETNLYGEGFNMLSQYEGTLGEIGLVGQYSDRVHYRMHQRPGYTTVYNLALLSPPDGMPVLLAFTSCNRFCGEIRFGEGRYEVVLDCENLSLAAGEVWMLEEFGIWTGDSRELLLDRLAERIQLNHPRLAVDEVPTGWCSWYCYGPEVTEQDVLANLKALRTQVPELQYIQIDDGYQAYMGDWLMSKPEFADVKELCRKIRENGFEPAIWVAPFIAEEKSALFREHPEWFVKNAEGNPLSSADVSFGGWRSGPWYMLDGSHSEARNYLHNVFRTMREEWNCRYFKLDANMWGAMHGGFRFDSNASRVEAYRLGMEAVLKGAGDDCFLLGCNAPMWPSLGLVHGMRVTDDISRDWQTVLLLARQGFRRNWQHRRLWVNDPDCLVLDNNKVTLVGPDGIERVVSSSRLTEDEFRFHWSYVFASGGTVLSGDKITEMNEERIAKLRRCLPPTDCAARFDDASFRIGRVYRENDFYMCLFNPEDQPIDIEVNIPYPADIRELWTDEPLGVYAESLSIQEIPPHSARVYHGVKVERFGY